jgi:hypothetical protein
MITGDFLTAISVGVNVSNPIILEQWAKEEARRYVLIYMSIEELD